MRLLELRRASLQKIKTKKGAVEHHSTELQVPVLTDQTRRIKEPRS